MHAYFINKQIHTISSVPAQASKEYFSTTEHKHVHMNRDACMTTVYERLHFDLQDFHISAFYADHSKINDKKLSCCRKTARRLGHTLRETDGRTESRSKDVLCSMFHA